MGWHVQHSPIYKLRLSDNRIIYMMWMGIQGPCFYEDEGVQIDILDWYKDELIVEALERFQIRDTGH